MNQFTVLISGPNISYDEYLSDEIGKSAFVLNNIDNSRIFPLLTERPYNLILLEVNPSIPNEIETIKKIKHRCPSIDIILIDGDSNKSLISKAFEYGVIDLFRKPYKSWLLIERSHAILRHNNE